MITIRSGNDLKGKRHYYFMGLDTYESFDQVTSKVLQLGSTLLERVDSFYYRIALFEFNKKQFKILYHDDIGVYAFSVSDSNSDDWLMELLNIVVEKLNI